MILMNINLFKIKFSPTHKLIYYYSYPSYYRIYPETDNNTRLMHRIVDLSSSKNIDLIQDTIDFIQSGDVEWNTVQKFIYSK